MDKSMLIKFWKKNIERNIYRVVSEEYVPDIKAKGINPSNDPFREMLPKIKQIYSLMLKMEMKGFIYEEQWRDGPVKASGIIEVSRASMDNNYIDFVSDYGQALKFRKKWRGGALTNVVFNFSNFLLEDKVEMSDSEMELVKSLLEWAIQKRKYPNRIMAVKGSSKCFENAKLLLLPRNGQKRYLQSPYGSLEHFLKITKDNLTDYEPYLLRKELCYIRVFGKIEAKEVVKVF